MFDILFEEYTDECDPKFRREAISAGNALEEAIRTRFSLEEYVDQIEDHILKYSYECEKCAFKKGFAAALLLLAECGIDTSK